MLHVAGTHIVLPGYYPPAAMGLAGMRALKLAIAIQVLGGAGAGSQGGRVHAGGRAYNSEQASLRLRRSGVGGRIILNYRRAGLPIILNGPLFLFLFMGLVGYLHAINPCIWPHLAMICDFTFGI